MNKKNVVLLAKNSRSNSFDQQDSSVKNLSSERNNGLFSSFVQASSTVQENFGRYDSVDLASSLYTNADKILKRIAQEVETYHNLTPKKTEKPSQSQCEIQQCSVFKDQAEQEKCTKKIRKSKKDINIQADNKMKKEIVGLKNRFSKIEEPVSKQQIWKIHDKYTFIIQSMAKELFQQKKKYQQLLNFYKSTEVTTNNIFDDIKNKSISEGVYRDQSNALLTIDEVSQEQEKTSIAMLSQQPLQNKEDFKNKPVFLNQPRFDMRKSKTTENLMKKDNSVIDGSSSPSDKNPKTIQLSDNENDNSMITKMQLLLESGSRKVNAKSKNIIQDEISKTIQNNLDHIPVSILDDSSSSLKKSLIKEVQINNEQFTEQIIQIQAKYQGMLIERQCKNQEYINAVDQYYQQHINNIYENTKEAINKVISNPDQAEGQLKNIQKLELQELKKQLHILKTNNKNMVKVLGDELQERISSIFQQIYTAQFTKLMRTNQELVGINRKLQNYVSKLKEEKARIKSNNNTTLDDTNSSRSFLNYGCQTHQVNQNDKKLIQQLENKMIYQYEKMLQKQIEMTEKQVLLSERIVNLQNKIKQLEEIRQMDFDIFERQKQYMKMIFDKEVTKLKQETASTKNKKDKNNENIGFSRNSMKIFKQKIFSPNRQTLDFKESTVKSINLNDNWEQIKSKSPFDQFPQLLSNLVFKKTMTIETGGHSSHGGD